FTYDPQTQTGRFSGTIAPGAAATPTYNVTVTATDTASPFPTTIVSFTWIVTRPAMASPICSTATASPSTLWPPNHRFVPIVIRGVTDPDGDPIKLRITKILQDEPTFSSSDFDWDDDDCDESGDHGRHRSDDNHGAGFTPIDGFSLGTLAFVRAERSS